jgi:DNA-binding transcriptional LysR family regulator
MASANSRLRVHMALGDFENLSRDVLANRLEFAIADTAAAERHPTRLAIEPVAEHRVFFFVREGHPLTSAKEFSLETILVFPLVAPRLPQRIAVHVSKSVPNAKVDRDTGDLTPGVMLDSFAVARNVVLSGDAIGIAPLSAIEADVRAKRLALIRYDAPWMHLSYGLFYPRKRALSRVAQLFVTQLRQVESAIQANEQRSLARLNMRKRTRKSARSRTAPATAKPRTAKKRR